MSRESNLYLTATVGTFDEAFKSRIQLALHYPPLNADDRQTIWWNFIQGLREEVAADCSLQINHEELMKKRELLARHQLNGRQIRNTIRTARQLALFKNQELSYSHVEQTIREVKEFERYIDITHGHTDSDRLASEGIRIDRENV